MRGEKRRKTNVEKEIGAALWWEKCKKLSLPLDTCHWVNATKVRTEVTQKWRSDRLVKRKRKTGLLSLV